MRFLVDAQLPPDLARWLIEQGHEAAHVIDVGLRESSDAEIWDYAADSSRVIVSKDEDFAVRVQLGHAGPAVIWLRFGNTRTRPLIERCASVWAAVVEAVDRGERLIEVS